MTILAPLMTDIRPLRAHCTGSVVVPGEGRWLQALADVGLDPADEPAAIAFPADPFDIAAILAFAGNAALRTVRAEDLDEDADVREAIVIAAPRRPRRFRRTS
jgi:hypothetical protein